EATEGLGSGNGGTFIDSVTSHQAAVLGALFPQDPGQAAGVDVGDAHNIVVAQILIQRRLLAPAAGQQGQIADDQPGGPDLAGLVVFFIDAGVADMGIGERHHLARVGGIGEDLLIAGEGSVEHHFTYGLAVCSNGYAPEQCSIFKGQDGGFAQDNLQ